MWYYFLYSFNRYLPFNLKRKVYLHLPRFLVSAGVRWCPLVAFLTMEERHQRTPADTSSHQARRTRTRPGHIPPPDGVPEGHVPRSEAQGFLRDSGKIPLFRLQIIRFLTEPGGEYKKSNRITSDCFFILYLLSFLHTFHFIIFAKNKKL